MAINEVFLSTVLPDKISLPIIIIPAVNSFIKFHMKIDPRLIHVKFLKRYKRFFSDVVLNKKKITVHCPNSGSMLGLLNEKNDAWISKSDNPNRKLKIHFRNY